MNNAIIYARVSSKEQEVEGFSIPAQIKLLKEYAVQQDIFIRKEFIDVETAKKSGRTQFNAMINFMKENSGIKYILVEKTDRLLRNIPDYSLIDELMEQHGVTVHLVKENTVLHRDSRSNEKFIFGIKTLMAKNFVDNLSEESKKGMTEKAEQGTYPSYAPYGYLNKKINEKKVIVIDPDSAPFIKRMFELYATGSHSLKSLRLKMIEEGMVYRNGKRLYKSNVDKMLKNEFYTGMFIWRGKRYENASHEPIVSKELFQKVQQMFSGSRKSKSQKGLFPYCNLMICGCCNCAISAQIQKGKYIYYHCSGYKGNCKQPYVRQESIEQQFEKVLHKIKISKELQEMIFKGLRESLKDKIEYHNTCVANMEREIKILQHRIDQSYLDKLDGKISENFWKTQTDKWLVEKEKLSLKLVRQQKADTNYLKNADIILELARKAAALFKQGNAQQKKQIVNLLVSNCSLKDGKLDIELRSPFRKLLESANTENWRP